MGMKPRANPDLVVTMPSGKPVVLMARPLGVGPLSWPTAAGSTYDMINLGVGFLRDRPTKVYGWATIHPDKSGGWTAGFDVTSVLPETDLEELVDAWYDEHGTWPWEFCVVEVETPTPG